MFFLNLLLIGFVAASPLSNHQHGQSSSEIEEAISSFGSACDKLSTAIAQWDGSLDGMENLDYRMTHLTRLFEDITYTVREEDRWSSYDSRGVIDSVSEHLNPGFGEACRLFASAAPRAIARGSAKILSGNLSDLDRFVKGFENALRDKISENQSSNLNKVLDKTSSSLDEARQAYSSNWSPSRLDTERVLGQKIM